MKKYEYEGVYMYVCIKFYGTVHIHKYFLCNAYEKAKSVWKFCINHPIWWCTYFMSQYS